jgi:hypothetical protein
MLNRLLVAFAVVIALLNPSKQIPVDYNRNTNVTIYSNYNRHLETKGRGVLIYSTPTSGQLVLTAAHVINEKGTPKTINAVDAQGYDHKVTVFYVFKKPADLAIVCVDGPLGKNKVTIGDSPREGDYLYSFDYPDSLAYEDASIPNITVSGRVVLGPYIFDVFDPLFGMLANYKSHSGMSGGGVYNRKGELVGIHNATSVGGSAIFTPIRLAVRDEKKDLEKVFSKNTLIDLGLL